MDAGSSVPRLGDAVFSIFENAQSVAGGRKIEEPLIFQSELEEHVARGEPKEDGKEKNAWDNDSHGQEHRNETKPKNTGTHHRQERT